MIKRMIKAVLRTIAPNQYNSLMAARDNRRGLQLMAEYGVPAITSALVARHGAKVLSGPFVGMSYLTEAAGSAIVPKLVGSYECELHSILEMLLTRRYETVVDVGSAEGFYAVGLAMRLPGSPRVYAFDSNPQARILCRTLAQMNQVAEKVIISGHCDAKRLQKTLQGRSLVVCDCEGFEVELLQPSKTPALALADILVELHTRPQPGITPAFLDRFRASHALQLLDTAERNPADYPVISFLEPEQQIIALSEFRGNPLRGSPQQWAFLTPLAAATLNNSTVHES